MWDQHRSHSSSEISVESISHSDMVEQLLPFELADIELLQKHIQPEYQPGADPICMVVGLSGPREASILREFHRQAYELTPDTVKVVGCNSDIRPIGDRYDLTLLGEIQGDALDSATWLMPLLKVSKSSRAYDIAYIRNPDLVRINKWADIFARAAEFTSNRGYVVSLVRDLDFEKMNRLIKELESEYELTPEISLATGVHVPEDDSLQHAHLVAYRGTKSS